MIQPILNFLGCSSKAAITAYSIGLVIGVGLLDYAIRSEIHLLLLYLVPIAVASWYVSRDAGILIAVLCSLAWFIGNTLNGYTYSAQWVGDWNFVMRTGLFIVFALVQAQLRFRIDELSALACRDFLTGLPNGRAFYERAAAELDRAFGLQPLSLAYVDIAGFQWFNRRYGYATGDQMICTVGHVIRKHVPRPDLVGRLGGTSFAVLLPNTGPEGANFILETVHNALKEERRRFDRRLTFFISAIACTKAPRSIAELLQEAESQMARMKGGKKDVLEVSRVGSLHSLN